MLKEYEKENNTGMNIDEMAKLIYDYTSGDPVLVSNMAMIYGFAKNKENIVCVANRLFETRIYNWFLSLEITTNKITAVV